MKQILLMAILLTVHGISKASDVYDEYKRIAQVKANSLVIQYFGLDASISDFDEAPAGLFQIKVSMKGGQSRSFYMLPDQQHLIEGVLYSPLITEKNEAHGVRYLERIAEQNIAKQKVMSNFSRSIRQNVVKKEGPFKGIVNGNSIRDAFEQPVTSVIAPNALETGFDYDQYFERLGGAHIIKKGEGENVIYVFLDMECVACIKTHPIIDEMAKKHGVAVHYIPVGFQTDESKAKAILALMTDDNEERLKRLERFIGNKKLTTLIDTSIINDAFYESAEYDAALKKFNLNNQLFYSGPNPVTPTFAFIAGGRKQVVATATPSVIEKIAKTASVVKQNAP